MPRQNFTSSVQISAQGRRFLNLTGPGGGISQFLKAVQQREIDAAKVATDTSRSVFTSKLSGRPLAPPRPGRQTTGGAFGSLIQWIPDHTKGTIALDQTAIRQAAWYYLIQEIGTGQSAQILNPPGAITIPTQRGRLIKSSWLQWAPGPGSPPSPPGRGGPLEQLYLATDLNNATRRTRRMRIRREIKGKHYLRDGGNEGFRVLSTGLIADAQRIFQ